MRPNKPLDELGVNDQNILAYIAGFFDAEGFINMRNAPLSRSFVTLRCGITQKDRTPLDMIIMYYGGSIYKKHWTRNNRLYECWGWGLTTRHALKFLKDIYPYVIVKKPQVYLAIQHQEKIVTASIKKVDSNTMDDRIKQMNLIRALNKSKVVQLELDVAKSNELQGVLI
jgi:hypothetical protein